MKMTLDMTGGVKKNYNIVRIEPLQDIDQEYNYRVQGQTFRHNYADGALVCAFKAIGAMLIAQHPHLVDKIVNFDLLDDIKEDATAREMLEVFWGVSEVGTQ